MRKNKKDYEVIVIGAGVAGLTCAAALARQGKRVLLLEKHFAPGGYCTSFSRRGYSFDTTDHFINGCHKAEILGPVFDLLGLWDKVEFCKPQFSETLLFRDMKYKVPNDVKEFREKLLRDFPAHRAGLEEFFDKLELLKSRDYYNPEFLKYYMMPYRSFIDCFIKDDVTLFNILAGGYAYIGNIDCPAIFMAYLSGYPKYYPIGGMQVFSDKLAEIIRESGGEVRLSTPVSRILYEDGQAYGVRLQSGEEILCDTVVSAIDAKRTYLELMDKEGLPPKFLQGIQKMQPSMSTFVIYLGVREDLKKYGADSSLICIYDDIDNGTKMTQDRGYTPERPVDRICVSMLGLKHEGTAGEEKQSIMANCFAPYSIEGGWRKNKAAMTERVLERLKLLLPGIEDKLELVEAATPETLERYTANYEGSSYGFDRSVEQTRLFHRNYNPPIKGLYHIGHTAGGFYSGLAGAILSGYDIACKLSTQPSLDVSKE